MQGHEGRNSNEDRGRVGNPFGGRGTAEELTAIPDPYLVSTNSEPLSTTVYRDR